MCKDKKSMNKDIFCIFFIAFLLIGMNFICLGFAENGLDAPLSYNGSDGFTEAEHVKTVSEQNFAGETPRLGAPYGSVLKDFQLYFFYTERFISFLITRFTKDCFLAFNIQFLITIALCGIAAFIVLRQINISRLLAFVGAIIYGTTPYIYSRGMDHFCLTACYCIPFSILLCIWVEQKNKDYLSTKKTIIVLLCFLIANNSMYYTFFTCFLLFITAVTSFIKTGNICRTKKALFFIGVIISFSILSLTPSLVYKIQEGSNPVARRTITDLELYGLKIVQLFLPTNSHHIPYINKIVKEYNQQAPLVNENTSAYLGAFACLGFITLLIIAFDTRKKANPILHTFSTLTIWSLLFFSVGGLITLVFLITGFRYLRGLNRISIYIAFMSIATNCMLIQRLLSTNFIQKKYFWIKICYKTFIFFFILYCVWEQHPSHSTYSKLVATNKIERKKDIEFINEIESCVKVNDMILQLPYHKYPEAGSVNNMADYSHLRAYLNSTKLRWSYGGMKGRKADIWNEKVSSLPMSKMIPVIVQSGFRGIYIDSRAYSDEELESLCISIENVLENENPHISRDKTLLFYNLYPYLDKHPDLKETVVYDAEYTEWFYPFNGQNISDGFDKDGIRYLNPNGHSFGPYIPLQAGSYTATIKGKNLSSHFIDVYSHFGDIHHDFTEEGDDSTLLIRFALKTSVENIEIFIRNEGENLMEMETFIIKKDKK